MDDVNHSSPPPESSAHAAESFYKKQLDAANKEKAQLQQRIRQVESQNSALLKSLFELSCTPLGATPVKPMPLDVVSALRKLAESSQPSPNKPSTPRRTSRDGRFSSSLFGTHVTSDDGLFIHAVDLKAHHAAVYSVQFSPNGSHLASVSFDRSLRLWQYPPSSGDVTQGPVLSICDAHRAPIVTAQWTYDSTGIVTGALDQSAALWDIGAQRMDAVARFPCDGPANAVSVSPANDNVFFVVTTHKNGHLFDRRLPTPSGLSADNSSSTVIRNDSVMNTVHVDLDGFSVVTGDHAGCIKKWDVRNMQPQWRTDPTRQTAPLLDTTLNDRNGRPITHIHTSPPLSGGAITRYMAVNSYDTYLRLYDCSAFAQKEGDDDVRALHTLRGVANTHWPIKSSFFCGAKYSRPVQGRSRQRRTRSLECDSRAGATDAGQDEGAGDAKERQAYDHLSDGDGDGQSSFSEASGSSDEDGDEQDEQLDAEHVQISRESVDDALLLASGSADSKVYVFDVGGRSGRAGLLQTLEGHKDRVYTAAFHPCLPVIASCSADSDIRIWRAR